MQSAFDEAVEYVHDRKQFGQSVGTFQLMQGAECDENLQPTLIILLQPKLPICIPNSTLVDLMYTPLHGLAIEGT